MKLKKTFILFSVLIILSLLLYQWNFAQNPTVSSTTIVFKSDARLSGSPSTVTKQEYCAMSEHYGNSSCGTATASDHPIATSWDPSDRKVMITMKADVVGYGEAKASITSGSTSIGAPVLNLGGDVIKVGTWGGGEITGAASATPTEYTVFHDAHFYCPPKAEPKTYTWTASGKVEIWGVDWEGTGTVEVTTTVGVELGLSPAATYQVGVGVASSVTDDVSGNASDRLKTDTQDWVVANNITCGDSKCREILTDPHAHHWWCPNADGCGYHIICKKNIPDKHQLHASCWNEKYGCNEANVRKCTHKCEHEPVECPRCNENVSTRYEHYKTCGSEVPGATAGCSVGYWTCKSSTHDVLACARWNSNATDLCGMLYRQCTNPRAECLYRWNRWQRHKDGVEICEEGCFGSSCSGCQHLNP